MKREFLHSNTSPAVYSVVKILSTVTWTINSENISRNPYGNASQILCFYFIQNNQYTVAMMILTHKIKKANGLIKNTIVCVAILRIPIQIWTNSIVLFTTVADPDPGWSSEIPYGICIILPDPDPNFFPGIRALLGTVAGSWIFADPKYKVIAPDPFPYFGSIPILYCSF